MVELRMNCRRPSGTACLRHDRARPGRRVCLAALVAFWGLWCSGCSILPGPSSPDVGVVTDVEVRRYLEASELVDQVPCTVRSERSAAVYLCRIFQDPLGARLVAVYDRASGRLRALFETLADGRIRALWLDGPPAPSSPPSGHETRL